MATAALKNRPAESKHGSKDAADPVRVNVNMPKEVYNELQEAARESGISFSTFVRNALRLYHHLNQERRKGKQFYIGKDDRPEIELFIV